MQGEVRIYRVLVAKEALPPSAIRSRVEDWNGLTEEERSAVDAYLRGALTLEYLGARERVFIRRHGDR